MNRTTHVYRVTRHFIDDHWGRDLGWSDRVVDQTRTHYFVRMTDTNAADLISDADYYMDKYGPDMGPGFKSSARATFNAMMKQRAAIRANGCTAFDRVYSPGCYA